MANLFTLSARDHSLLRLLGKTLATTSQLLAASVSFADGAFRDERRLRERLQSLANAKLVEAFSLGQIGGGLKNYYKLSPEGFRLIFGEQTAFPHRSFFAPIIPSRLEHTLQLADVIVHTQVAAHRSRIAMTKFFRENELVLKAGELESRPDCSFQFAAAGRWFNVLFEIDRSTESVDSAADSSIRQKILGYEAYQDVVWRQWRSNGCRGARPAYRVAFLTPSTQRAYHILTLAARLARNPDRRLCYAATLDAYLSEANALREPLFLDHAGGWQSLVNEHPTANFRRAPIRFPTFVEPPPL